MITVSFRRLALMFALVAGLPIPVAAQDLAPNGAESFVRLGCAGCHGPRGSGTAIAPSIAGSGLGAAQFTTAVRVARGVMPAFNVDVVSEETLTALRAFLASQPSPPRPMGRVAVGGQRYEQVGCYSCHSNQGQGGTQGPRIGPEPIRWERFRWYVRRPAGQMPPYAEAVLGEQDLADIYAFLAARPVPQPLADIPLLRP